MSIFSPPVAPQKKERLKFVPLCFNFILVVAVALRCIHLVFCPLLNFIIYVFICTVYTYCWFQNQNIPLNSKYPIIFFNSLFFFQIIPLFKKNAHYHSSLKKSHFIQEKYHWFFSCKLYCMLHCILLEPYCIYWIYIDSITGLFDYESCRYIYMWGCL